MTRLKIRYSLGIRKFFRAYRRSKLATVALVLVVILNACAIAAKYIAPFPAREIAVGSPFIPPFNDLNHFLGTDDLGRDILSETIWGSQASLLVSYSVVLFSTIIGLIIGSFAGFFGGWIDGLLSRLTEVFFILPTLILALVLVSLYRPNIYIIIFALVITNWPSTARLVRAEYLSLRKRGFVEAARAVGASTLTIMYREILPNAAAPVIVNSVILLARAIMLEAFLGFFGLSDPYFVSWGRILARSTPHFMIAWWTVIMPGIALSVTIISLNIIGERLDDVVSTRLEGSVQ